MSNTTTTDRNWAEKYRHASRTTLEGWIFLSACNRVGDESEEFLREVGRIAYTSGCCIWHARWVAGGRQNLCFCADCERERKAVNRRTARQAERAAAHA